jgi:hypothetical protein
MVEDARRAGATVVRGGKSPDGPYGLAASAWTTNVYRAGRASREIQAGCVWINDHVPIISEMPHGGHKASGFGKDMSAYSFDEYTDVRHVMSDITGDRHKSWHDVVFTSPWPLPCDGRPEAYSGWKLSRSRTTGKWALAKFAAMGKFPRSVAPVMNSAPRSTRKWVHSARRS